MFSNVGIIFLVVLYMIAGAFMFIAIEGNEALERFAQIPSKRIETAMRLWQISCCEVNVFNKSVFEERRRNTRLPGEDCAVGSAGLAGE